MAIKHHIPGGKGTFWPPYTATEKRQMEADLYPGHPNGRIGPYPGQCFGTHCVGGR